MGKVFVLEPFAIAPDHPLAEAHQAVSSWVEDAGRRSQESPERTGLDGCEAGSGTQVRWSKCISQSICKLR